MPAVLMCHRVEKVIGAEFERSDGFMQRSLTAVKPFPVLAQIIVVVDDDLNISFRIEQCLELDRLKTVGRRNLETIDVVKRVENRMIYIQRYQIPIRIEFLQLRSENREIALSSKIINKNESAAIQIFAQ